MNKQVRRRVAGVVSLGLVLVLQVASFGRPQKDDPENGDG